VAMALLFEGAVTVHQERLSGAGSHAGPNFSSAAVKGWCGAHNGQAQGLRERHHHEVVGSVDVYPNVCRLRVVPDGPCCGGRPSALPVPCGTTEAWASGDSQPYEWRLGCNPHALTTFVGSAVSARHPSRG
jgi:hypothetical protein